MKRAAKAPLVIALVAAMTSFTCLREADLPKSSGAHVVTGSLASPLANQAAAADEKFVYAVDDGVVAKHDRSTGKELARSVGKAQHLNSGFLWEGKLCCAHSNCPKKPHQSDIRVLDPETMKLDLFHAFDAPPASPPSPPGPCGAASAGGATSPTTGSDRPKSFGLAHCVGPLACPKRGLPVL